MGVSLPIYKHHLAPGSEHKHTVQQLLLPEHMPTLGAVKDADAQRACFKGPISYLFDLTSIYLSLTHPSGKSPGVDVDGRKACLRLFPNHQAVSLLPRV